MGTPTGEEEETGTKSLLREIIDENCPILWKETLEEANRTSNFSNSKRPLSKTHYSKTVN